MLVAENDVHGLVDEVWSAVLGLEITQASPSQGLVPGEHAVVAAVSIEGSWNGYVEVACSYFLSQKITAVMFEIEPEEALEEDIGDALGEVVNMVGGHMKALLEGENQLGIPELAWEYDLGRPDTEVESRVVLHSEGEPVVVTTFARQQAEV